MSNGTKAKKWEEEQRQKLEKVYELYGSRMYYRAMQILNQREDAEDAVQNSIIAIFLKISKNDHLFRQQKYNI